MRDAEWLTHVDGAGWMVNSGVVCPNGTYYIRAWGPFNKREAMRRLRRLEELRAYLASRKREPGKEGGERTL